MILTCKNCGNSFKTSHKDRINCSKKCYLLTLKGIKPPWLPGFNTETAKKYGFQKGNKWGFPKGYFPHNKGKTYDEVYGKERANEIKIKKKLNRPDISGKNHPCWKGDKAKYQAIHIRIRRILGKATKCSNNSKHKGMFVWANISGEYKRTTSDWHQLCHRCNLTDGVKIHPRFKNI